MVVDVFIPCFIDQFYPETGFNMIKLLEKLDVEVHYNPKQTCCGQMAFNSGFREEATDLGVKFIQDFNNGRPVVGLSASCLGYIKKTTSKNCFITLLGTLKTENSGQIFGRLLTF